ncbi:hypothetical protein F5890DRAFT_1655725 [Lentinula detonsa]|uniref:Uncharacterized protein n=1 Tax=Lentinula detonsa TaxID=2804962 RepID=A0AA38PN61_9AGAR|nr:hypothetical protein F5890DRAFT_1655725 [Lentinula detonsa]
MSSNPNNNETAQQRRECLLLAQAERQRIRDEEIARQEAEFAAEMEKLEAEAAREEEERRIEEERKAAEEKQEAEERRRQEVERRREEERKVEEERVAREKRAEEKRIAEKKLAEERELAEAMRLEEERIAELKRFEAEVLDEENRVAEEKQERNRIAEAKRREEERVAEGEDAQEQNNAFAKFVEENRVEKEKAAKKLAKRREPTTNTAWPVVSVVIPSRASGSTSKVFKSKSVISDESDDVVMDEREVETPRSLKRKCPAKMITKNGSFPNPNSDRDVDEDDEDVGSPSHSRSACTRCVLLGKPASCKPQSTRRRTQACEPCHVQRQRCSWIGDHTSRRSRGKRAKLEDDVYRGPAVRVMDRKFAGPGVAEQLAVLAGQNLELVGIARHSLEEKMLSIMERREQRELEGRGIGGKEEEDEDEDEDGEGDEDEEEKEKNNEKRKNEIREGKKCAE